MQKNKEQNKTLPGAELIGARHEDVLTEIFASIETELSRSLNNDRPQFHTRSNLFKLLEMLNMQHEIVGGKNNHLYALLGEKSIIKILDATGGYGANLLGHKNPIIAQAAIDSIQNSTPNLIQGCMRKKANKLAKRLSELLNNELEGENQFETVFSNSGTEAVEAAIKFSLMKHHSKMLELRLELEKSYNQFEIAFNQLHSLEQEKLIKNYSSNFSTIEEVLNYIREYNDKVINRRPNLIALKNSFHGKSLGSLELTYNPKFRTPFFLSECDTVFIERNNEEEIAKAFESKKMEIIFLTLTQEITEFKRMVQKTCALIVEPIQGEAGVYELSGEYLLALQKECLNNKALFIIDEIQSGTFRVNKLAASSHTLRKSADIYIFSKALGAGVAKIGTTLINKKIYDGNFDMIHTSTFADDDFSCDVALCALDLLTSNDNTHKLNIKDELLKLKKAFPLLIKEVRGNGLMLAIELDKSLSEHSYEFKFFYDMGHLGSLLASAFLNNEQIRINTTLSNQLTFRIQLSAFYENEDVEFLLSAFSNLLNQIENENSKYFFSHLFKGFEIKDFSPIKKEVRPTRDIKKKAVFLNHPIKTQDLKKITNAFSGIDDSVLDEVIESSFEFLKFEPYFNTVITDDSGEELEIIMLSIPIPSHILKKIMHSKKNIYLQEKLQAAVQKAKDLGASVVGLGQFTSIISQNGLTLNSLGLSLTTGNPYTTHLSCKAFEEATNSQENINLACFGLTGNILSQVVKIISTNVDSIRIFHHEDLSKSKKFQKSLVELINHIRGTDSRLSKNIKKFLITDSDQQTILEDIKKIDSYIIIENDKSSLQQCNAVVLGTNTNEILVYNQHISSGTVVMDLGVPHNLDPQLFLRNDIAVILGGVAHLPISNSKITIDIPSYPLSSGEVFACMAETFSLGFHGPSKIKHIGEVNLEQIDKIASIATKHGFGLKCSKVTSSL